MNSYIQKLKSKPEDSRKRILMASLVVSMTLVVSVWVYNLGDHFKSNAPDQAMTDLKPFSMLASSVSDSYKNAGASAASAVTTNASGQKQIDLIPVEHPQQ